MTNLADKLIGWTCACIILYAIFHTVEARGETIQTVTFLPIKISVCDSLGQKKGLGKAVAVMSYQGGKKEGWQWLNQCLYKHATKHS